MLEEPLGDGLLWAATEQLFYLIEIVFFIITLIWNFNLLLFNRFGDLMAKFDDRRLPM